jgi:hypothetical protein
MDTFLHIIGLCSIPFMLLLIISGVNEIIVGLNEYFNDDALKVIKIREQFHDCNSLINAQSLYMKKVA